MVRSKKLFALAAAGALVLAACGSDDDASTDTEAPAETEAPADTEAPTDSEAPADTEAPTDGEAPEDTEAPDDGGEAYAVDLEACEDPDAASAPIEGNIKIGTSIPLSGGPAAVWAPIGAGQQAYIDYYNAEFGGVNGQQLELVAKDDQYTADLTKANVDELIFDDEVAALTSIVGTAHNLAIQAETNAQCVPQLWAATGAPEWGDLENYPWTTGMLVPYPVEAEAWAQYVVDTYGEGATVAIFAANNDFGAVYVDAFTESAEAHGIEIVAQESIEATDSGAPSGQMTNLVAAAPDAILAAPLGAQCIAFMTELGNARAANPDFNPDTYVTATCASSIIFGVVTNGGSTGVFTSNNLKDVGNEEVVASDEEVARYIEAFTAAAPDADPAGIGAAGWNAMELTVHNIQEAADAGNLSRQGIMDAARNINYESGLLLNGLVYSMDANDAFISEGTQLRQWDGSGFVSVGDVIDLEGTLGTFGG